MKSTILLWLFRPFVILFFTLAFSLNSFSQLGCTDELACNYDSEAVTDDGSCTYTGYFIPVDYSASGTPAVQACLAPDGFYFPDQTCVEDLIAEDPYCINIDWDQTCQDALNECLGCDEPSWFIPAELSSGPAVFACSAPEGYWEGNQDCIATVVSNDGYCTVTSWDSLCQNAYNDCLGCEDAAWYIPFDVGSGPAVFACNGPIGYWQPDQDCVTEVIGADSYCVVDTWDSICQNAYESACFECDEPQWYIPVQVGTGPPVLSCTLPDGYWLPDQTCVEQVILNDPFCIDTEWDSLCQDDYNACLGCPEDAAWFIPIEVGSGPAVFACEAPDGYWAPDQACVTEVIANDSFCTETLWDNFCQQAFNSCAYGCSNAQWYLPETIGEGPAILECTAPEGYELAENQDCAEQIIAGDPWCLETDWDNICNNAYNACNSGCTYSFACNYDPIALDDDGSCEVAGCTDDTALNYNPDAACEDGSCVYGESTCPGDFDDSGIIGTSDLLFLLGNFGSFCP